MAAVFIPVNSLEIALRKLISREDGRVWQFLTPMAAATLWFIAGRYPECDGSDLLAPPGENPRLCVFHNRRGRVISVYTAEERVRAAMARLELPAEEYLFARMAGHALLKWLHAEATHDENDIAEIVVNFGVDEAFYHAQTEMIGYLLEKPAPPPEPETTDADRVLHPEGDPERSLGPLRDFLMASPDVRAAWVLAGPPGEDGETVPGRYDLALVMTDPEDRRLQDRVNLILKAVTPVDEEWSAAFLFGPDADLRKMAAERAPFYAAPGFLAE